MTKWPNKIEKYRTVVCYECRDIPPDLILAIIIHESQGKPGIPAYRQSKSRENIPTMDGQKWVDRAYGLMQTVPGTVLSYNQYQESLGKKNEMATWEDISGTDERAIRVQILIGCYYLAAANKLLHDKFPNSAPAISLSNASEDQLKLVLAAYAVGAGNVLEKLSSYPTFSQISKQCPDWGLPHNRPIHYADTIFASYQKHRSNSYDDQKYMTPLMARTSKTGIIWLFFAVGFWIFWKGYNENT